MKQRARSGAAWASWAVSLVVVVSGAAFGQGPIEDDRVEDQLVIELEQDVSIDVIADRYDVVPIESIPEWRFWRVETPPGAVDMLVDLMKDDPDITRVEPHRNAETPEGTKRSMSDLDLAITVEVFMSQPAFDAAHVGQAHASYTGQGVVVAVVDTGISVRHPVVADRVLDLGTDFAGGDGTGVAQDNGLDDDGDGLVDESSNHGTFVAGIVHLIAPDAGLLPVRVLEADGKGTAFALAKGIKYAVGRGADVINLSLAMAHDSRAVERAIEYAEGAGVVVVAPTGNRGIEFVEFPASRPESIAVAAVDGDRVRAEFSSYGPETDISAQGTELISALTEEYFARWEGTSFAVPFVSGAVALLLEKYPGLTPSEVRGLLRQTAQPDGNPPELDGLMGAGVVDVERLTEALARDRTSLRAARLPGGTAMRWSPVLDATHYDVARGSVENLALVTSSGATTIDLGELNCIVDDVAFTTTEPFPDPSIPPPGSALFYVFRDDAPLSGVNAYGTDGRGHPRYGSGTDCTVAVIPN